MQYEASQLLALWRLLYHYEPVEGSGIVDRCDALDLDALLMAQIDAWYARQLAEAPPELLGVEDIKDETLLTVYPDGTAVATLPDCCRRVVDIKLSCWDRPALIVTPESHPDLCRRQASPYARAGCASPVAVAEHRRLRLYSVPHGAQPLLERVMAVTHRPGTYTFDPSLLPIHNPA